MLLGINLSPFNAHILLMCNIGQDDLNCSIFRIVLDQLVGLLYWAEADLLTL